MKTSFTVRCEKCTEIYRMLEGPPVEWPSDGYVDGDLHGCELEDPFCPLCNGEGIATVDYDNNPY